MKSIRYATVCSGIEAPSVAVEPLGWKPVFFSEIEPFPKAVLAKRFPEVPDLGDFTKIDGKAYKGKVDVLIGGTPCQAFSVAGLRNSLSDNRGNLTLKFVELCDEIDPSAIVWENVPGVLSTRDNAFGCFLAGLVGADAPLVVPGGGAWPRAGVVAGPKRIVGWRILDARHFGVPHRRRRVFVVAGRAGDGWPVVEALLAKCDGVRGHSSAGGEARKTFARDSRTGSEKTIVLDRAAFNQGVNAKFDPLIEESDEAPTLVARGPHAVYVPETSATVTAKWAKGSGGPSGDEFQNLVATSKVRRLTPRECERLQGFPDDWTKIPWGKKPAEECPDGHRYKACGNSMAVPVVRWICQRLASVLE